MNDDDADQAFRQMADSFIHLANQHSDTTSPETVGMALLYAAARYAAFVVTRHAPDLTKYEADRSRAFEFFVGEYRRMLNENLDDHRKFYDPSMKYAHLMPNT